MLTATFCASALKQSLAIFDFDGTVMSENKSPRIAVRGISGFWNTSEWHDTSSSASASCSSSGSSSWNSLLTMILLRLFFKTCFFPLSMILDSSGRTYMRARASNGVLSAAILRLNSCDEISSVSGSEV
ncbi:hypothetical protein OGATHE_004841 [Ogataea polymorpha]|uniref:Uncharacterized protein n=1 Tax=Ogataea polymorpha TaxID=460523 RepID=A0A9P8P187_9ASCO|nr:hypothetical protein OGATHE_004841 [Ogataea polymorpha]